MTSSAEIVREHLKDAKQVMKKIMRSKRSAREFLRRAGFITKDGKPTRPYR